MPFKVLIPEDISDAGRRYLAEHGCVYKVLDDCSVENICREAADADAILARTVFYGTQVFEAAKKLKVIGCYGVGVDNIDVEAATRYGIQVCNTPVANTVSVAEHAVAFILACARNMVLQDRACRAGDYASRDRTRGVEVEGKVLGLIGCGRIGSLVARKCSLGLGMEVLAFDTAAPSGLPDCITLCRTPEEVYANADFLSLHVPLLPATRNLIDRCVMDMMKPTAYIINCARGGIVNEKDLYEAITEGRLAGAALDVFEKEPVDPENPLYSLDRVIVSPHNAAFTEEAADRMGVQSAQGIVEVLNGQPPTWPVNRLARRDFPRGAARRT